jgi:hypothetical protein
VIKSNDIQLCCIDGYVSCIKIINHTLHNLFRVNLVRFTRSGKSSELAYNHLYDYHVAPRPVQVWRNFFRAHTQIVDTSRRNSFAFRSLSLLAIYFRLFQRRLGAPYRLAPRAGPPLLWPTLPRQSTGSVWSAGLVRWNGV